MANVKKEPKGSTALSKEAINLNGLSVLFSKPLPSMRSGAFYNSFPYPTKISPEAIAVYIACITKPGDTVLDPFAGSGSTGIAALLCEHPTEQMEKIAKDFGVTPVWGKRNAILYEIGTYPSFAIKTLTNRIKGINYKKTIDEFLARAQIEVSKLYSAKDPDGNFGSIRYTIWSEILICPECGRELEYFKYGTTRNPVSFKDTIKCPYCAKVHAINEMPFAKEEYYDKVLHKTISRKKRTIAWVYGETNGKNWDRAAVKEDSELVRAIDNEYVANEIPRKIEWGDLYRAGYHYGITHLHHFYTIRNYCVMKQLWELAKSYPDLERNVIELLLLSYNATNCTLMTRVVAKRNMKDFVLTSAQSGVLYISKLPVEKNILQGLHRKAKSFEEIYTLLEDCSGEIIVKNQTSTNMNEVDQSIDYVFTDPPFGDFIPYAEVNQINELWLPKTTKREDEIIISNAEGKTIDSYRNMLMTVFTEIGRTLKPNGFVTVVFHAAKAKVWNAFYEAISSAGFSIELSSILDKTQSTFKQIVSHGSVQGDPLFLLRKDECAQKTKQTDLDILRQILSTHPHDTELDIRHCYSIYNGQCMEKGITVSKDAKQVYEFIKAQKERK